MYDNLNRDLMTFEEFLLEFNKQEYNTYLRKRLEFIIERQNKILEHQKERRPNELMEETDLQELRSLREEHDKTWQLIEANRKPNPS